MRSKYHVKIKTDKDGYSDVYAVLAAYKVTDHAVGHAIKKGLMPGLRNNYKGTLQDLKEARWSLDRAIELMEQEG